MPKTKFDKLFIWGPNFLNNRLLAQHVQAISGIAPLCIAEAQEITETALKPNSLFICDCDKIEPKSYCRKIHRKGFSLNESPAIVLINIARDQDIIEEIMSYGIHGVFFLSDNFELLEKGVRKILAGEMWLSRKQLTDVLLLVRERNSTSISLTPASELTLREREILRLIAAGLPNQSIAERLYISTNTVKTHISNIYKKIDVVNRVQAILWANECLHDDDSSTEFIPFEVFPSLKN